ncbi:CHAT domain-containing protein [uncultured Aquimarina sp.]|uniref:CHAT domain-containing protein n=1 Tax=uncultured Aquimarina sp. TaxID=575652 RepID=UPI002629DEBE|nr:CHAT domain-containing protein [uncultured Aquimarina sp.]
MKTKYNKRCIILFLLLSTILCVRAQKRSAAFYEIINTKDYTDADKTSQIETLLKKHIKDKDSLQYGIDLTAFSFWLYNHGYFYGGISESEKAVDFYKTYKPYNKKLHIGNLKILGRLYSNVKDYTKSNRVYFEIIKLKNTKGDLGRPYKNIAENYQAEGNFHTATSYYKKAIEEFKKNQKHRDLFNTVISLSINYQKILDDESIKKGIKNLEILDSLKNKIDFDLYDDFLINETLGNLYNYENLFDTYTCLPYYKKALSLAKKQQDNRLVSSVYNNIGNIYYKINNDSALYYFKKALKPIHIDIIQTARIYYMIGRTHVDEKKYDAAYKSFITSLNVLKQNKTLDKSLYISILKQLAITLIKKHENTKALKNNIEEALIYLKEADRLIDLIKLESTHTESKLFWREQASDLYINLVKIYHLLNDTKSAYCYLEKNKALLLLEDLTKEHSKTFFNIPDSVLQREQKLKRKIAKTQNNLEGSEKQQIGSISLFDIEEEYKLFIDSLQHKYPAYYKSKENTDILSFEKVILEAEQQNTTFIHYILNDELGYGLVISKNKKELFKIHNIPLIQKYISKFNVLVSKPFSSNTDQKEFQKISEELSKNLLPDNLFKHKENKLIIIPDNNLLNLPFEALINKEGNYLIENYDISYAYSISFLEQNKQLERSYNKEFLGFAPIHFKNNLTTLTKSNKEINTVAKKFDSDILLKEEASSQNLLNSLSNYKIIHLSTHANANDSITPWIATNTEKITLNDIYSSKNNAELVTLSACNTSVGKLQKGEGVMSLARGFFNTGANSLISTLWKADDQSTQEIITDFYTYLKKGKSKSEALRQAKLIYLKNHSLSEASPYYWSSLVLIGNPEPMYSSINTWYLLIGILISSLIIFLIFKRFSKK